MMSDYLQPVMTVFSLINPVICAAMFSALEAGRPPRSQVADATKMAATVALILALAALLGVKVLGVFGISLEAFQVAGGGVLVWMGFSMLRGSSHTTSPKTEGKPRGGSITPLILFAASPGTITGVITLSLHRSGSALPVTTLVAVAVVVAATWAIRRIAARAAGSGSGGGLLHDVTTRFMGLIVLAMGVQFALAGIQAFTGGGPA
jgi:multiple antibiotic resistance protein